MGGTVLPLKADESKLPILPAPIIPPIPPQFMLPAQPFDNNMHHFQQQIPQNQLPWHWGPDSGAGKGNMMWGDMRNWGNNSQATIKEIWGQENTREKGEGRTNEKEDKELEKGTRKAHNVTVKKEEDRRKKKVRSKKRGVRKEEGRESEMEENKKECNRKWVEEESTSTENTLSYTGSSTVKTKEKGKNREDRGKRNGRSSQRRTKWNNERGRKRDQKEKIKKEKEGKENRGRELEETSSISRGRARDTLGRKRVRESTSGSDITSVQRREKKRKKKGEKTDKNSKKKESRKKRKEGETRIKIESETSAEKENSSSTEKSLSNNNKKGPNLEEREISGSREYSPSRSSDIGRKWEEEENLINKRREGGTKRIKESKESIGKKRKKGQK